ncbi:MAG: hypothetical protein Ct9H300mP7_1420 [Verrucomicrobiota bacterium]|nr:MAG: hypothetical protein Ct9H300mP7_1420 [Verrucomicrobiota bacterium]
MKASGYWTAAAGKWHLGNAVKDRFDEIRKPSVRFSTPPGEAAKPGEIVRTSPAMRAAAATSGCLAQGPSRDKPFFLWLAALDPIATTTKASSSSLTSRGCCLPRTSPTRPSRGSTTRFTTRDHRLDRFVGGVMAELKNRMSPTNVRAFYQRQRPAFPRDKTTLYDSGSRRRSSSTGRDYCRRSQCNSLVSSMTSRRRSWKWAPLSTPKGF